jgi:lipoprotein-anchoring transpeptidase ErfK/SrfK
VLAVATAAVAAATVLLDDRSAATLASADAPELALPDPIAPAFTVATPRPLGGRPPPMMWAPVVRDVVARGAPNAGARPIATVHRVTPEGTENVVLITGRAEHDGELWVRVGLAILPNNSTGWIPRDALGGSTAVHTRLVVDLERLTATLFEHGHAIFRAPVGVGKPAWPTPRGQFYVRNRVTIFRSPFYGPIAFGTSARSEVLTDWPAGGFIGIHGTDRPELLPGRVSHGCIRLRNADILRLARAMPVGTPITVR